MDNQVRYTVTAQDMLSGKLQGMNASAKGLESTMGGLTKVMSTLGVGFAVFKGLEFIKGGVEKFHELEQVTAKIEANLRSTGEVAGIGLKDVEGYSKGLSSHIQASRADVLDMASQLLTFPAITKDVFESSMGMVADIAKQTGHGLSETAIMYGKALNSPIDGLSAMRKYGIILTQQEKDKITSLQKSGHLIDAQKEMMKDIAHSGYAGVATAMFNADPLARFNKMMGSLQVSLGEVAMNLLTVMMPTLESIGQKFKDVGTWVKDVVYWFNEHKAITEVLVTFVGSLVAVLVLYNTQQKLSAMWTAFSTGSMIAYNLQLGFMIAMEEGATVAGGALAAVMMLLNAVNPFVWIAIAIAAVVAAVVLAYKHCETFRAGVWALWAVVKTAVGLMIQYFVALKDIIVGTFTLDLKQVEKGLKSMADLVLNSGKKIGESAKKGYKEGIGDFHADKLAEAKENKKGLAGVKKMATPATSATATSAKGTKGTSGVQSNKPVTINITIGSLIHDFKISTTNLKESSQSVHDAVVKALTGAVNDSQLIAGQ